MNRFLILLAITLLILACGDDTEPTAPINPATQSLFQKIPASQSGITHQSLSHPRDLTGLLSGGGGVAAGDINQDGLPDLLFSGGFNNCKLYLNKGNLQFDEISASAGIIDTGLNIAHSEGVNFVDVNGDGWLDIYILKNGLEYGDRRNTFTKYGANLLYINLGAEGKGQTFREAGKEYGLDIIGQSTAAQFFDYDNDGDLDVYIAQTPEVGSAFSFAYYQGRPGNQWLSDLLLENVNGRFVDVSRRAGILFEKNLSLSVSVADVNNDGFLDLYVANDFFGRDFLYINEGKKRFRERHAEFFTKTAMSAMGSDFADFNGDGYEDLFVGEMMPEKHKRQKLNLVPFSIEIYDRLAAMKQSQHTRNMLQINQAGEGFRDIGLLAGVHATEWSWSAFFVDADQDGALDLFVPNGIKRDMTNMDFVKRNFGDIYTDLANPRKQQGVNPGEVPSITTPNYIFQNQGDLSFRKPPANWGINDKVHTRGATYADLDNDGDPELILNNLDQKPILYQNFSQERTEAHYLKVKLQGKAANTYGLGANVRLYANGKMQSRRMSNQRGFQSGPEPVLFFGLGPNAKIDRIEVDWLGGEQSVVLNPTADQNLNIAQSGVKARPATRKVKTPLFSPQFSKSTSFQHREVPFNDFKSQRLLVRKYSTEGPAIGVGDLNGDGLDDYFVAGNATTPHWIIRGAADGLDSRLFRAIPNYQEDGEVQDVCVLDANGDGFMDVYLARGSNEYAADDARLIDRLFLNDGKGKLLYSPDALPSLKKSSHCVAPHDFDGDGDLDLFVGVNILPGDYGVLPSSYLLRNDAGKFVEASDEWAPELKDIGRVNKAIWTDFDQDGDKDLMLAGEWMPLSFLRNDGGKLVKTTFSTLSHSHGWYQALHEVDVDGDGDMDYIAGNFGLNTIFKPQRKQPMTLLTDDFDKNGSLDPVIFHYTAGANAPFANRDLFLTQMPEYNNRFFTFERYAAANWQNLFTAEQKQRARTEQVFELRSIIVENLGRGEFRIRPLPNEAQLAPVYAIISDDFTGDGKLDLILGGQFSGNHYEYGAIDASQGVLLAGDGEGGFEAVAAAESGIRFQHEVRDIVWVKGSGRPFMLVANNQGPFEWWRVNPKATN